MEEQLIGMLLKCNRRMKILLLFLLQLKKLNNHKLIVISVIQRIDLHNKIRENLHQSPLYSGKIKGIGPRYCPSIEDKVVKFADKDRHQLFLEPEGHNTNEVYLNGFSTSLPADFNKIY